MTPPDTLDRAPKPASWPLLFTHRSRVFGRGYIAEIELSGRLLAELEMEGVWLYGVNPGAIAVGAATLATANVDLHKALSAVFADFATAAADFAQFRGDVETFFSATDAESEIEWTREVQRMKMGDTVEAPGGLPLRDAVKTRIYVTVAEVTTITPELNLAADAHLQPQLAAAA